MTRETLDEALDRVASAMTAVTADPAFATRLWPRLQESPPITMRVTVAVAGAVVLAFAVGVGLFRNPGSAVNDLPELATAKTTAEVTGEPGSVAPSETSPPSPAIGASRKRSMVAADRSAESEPPPPGIAALPTPAVLDLEHLRFEPLAVEPVDVSSLQIAQLSLADIGAADDPRK